MNISISSRAAVKILLGVNVILLCGFVFALTAILLDASPGDLYGRVYYATYNIQPLVIYSWFESLVLGPVLAITFSLCFGYEVRKTVQWKISIAIMVCAGLPSVALLGIGLTMHIL